MPDPLPVLLYARPKRRHWRRWVVIGVIAVAAVAVGLKYAPAVRQKYTDWSRARAYAARFDAVAELVGERPWCWDGDALRNARTAATLRTLRGYNPRRGGEPEQILFIRTGQTNQDRWMVVGYADMGQLSVSTFYRDDWRNAPGYGGVTARVGPMDIKSLRPDDPAGETFTLEVDVQGGQNRFAWSRSIAPLPAATRANIETYTAKPTTGWRLTTGRWQPQISGARLVTLNPPPTTLPSVRKAETLAFAGDGQIVVADRESFGVVDIDSATMTESKLPPPVLGRSILSPDGGHLLLAGQNHARVIRLRDQVAVPTADLWGIGPFHGDAQHLTIAEGFPAELRRISWQTGATTKLGPKLSHAVQSIGRDVFVIIDDTGRLIVHRLDDRSVVAALENGPVSWASISPDGRWVIAGGDGTELYDVTTRQRVWRLSEVVRRASSIHWTPDGRLGVIEASQDVLLWSTDEPRWIALASFLRWRQYGYFSAIALSPDGQRLVAGGKVLAYWPSVPAATQPSR